MERIEEYKKAAEFIKDKLERKTTIGMILGSGLGYLAECFENKKMIEYTDIPGFPLSTVKGHAGRLISGKLMGRHVIAMQGRFHYYEGYTMDKVVFPVRALRLTGVEKLIVTNAAGGINRSFEAGDLMVITDHINMMGHNPLIGPNVDELGERFPGMTKAYDKGFVDIALACAKELRLGIKKGVYCGVTGPSYETPAEIKMLRIIGGDAVGMSTVPEVIAAAHCGMRVLGISCITNMAAGVSDHVPSHEKVLEVGQKSQAKFVALLKEILKRL